MGRIRANKFALLFAYTDGGGAGARGEYERMNAPYYSPIRMGGARGRIRAHECALLFAYTDGGGAGRRVEYERMNAPYYSPIRMGGRGGAGRIRAHECALLFAPTRPSLPGRCCCPVPEGCDKRHRVRWRGVRSVGANAGYIPKRAFGGQGQCG